MTRAIVVILLIGGSTVAMAGSHYTEIEASAGVKGLTGNSPAWRHQEIDWQHHESNGITYYAAFGHAERFALNDTYARGGLHLPVSPKWAFNAELDVSPEYHFLPRSSVYAAFDYTVRRGWILHAGFRHSSYQDSQANIATGGVETYIGAWRFAYTIFEGTSGGASGASHLLEADWYYGNRSHIGIALVRGRQAERIDPSRLEVTPVTAISLTGSQSLSLHWAVTYTVGVNSLQNIYTRRGVSVGVVYRY